jgi:hypothetical protein
LTGLARVGSVGKVMSRKKHVALVTSVVLVGAVAMANGCTTTTIVMVEAEGGVEGGVIVVHKDAGTSGSSSGGSDGSGDDSSSAVGYDGTTGQACTTDADCISTNTGAPGLVVCSLSINFTGGALFPTAVCMIPPTNEGNCSAPDDGGIHFCDGPDLESSPGLCFPISSGASTGNCFPQCVFESDATAPTGCVGKDACNAVGFGADPTNKTAAVGVGFCFGGCGVDADCPSGNHCQSNSGLCVTAPVAQDPEGQACVATAQAQTNACNCLSSNGANGFCGLACVTAGSVACPTGQVCDASLPTSIPATTTSAALTGWTTQNPGMAGTCLPTCALDGGAETEAGACYPTSTCLGGTAAGPDCEP